MNLKMAFKASFLLVACMSFIQGASISFDAPFPSTGYKKALDACMQVWGDVCVLRDNQEINAERTLLIDAVLGRLVYLDAAINEIVSAPGLSLSKDVPKILEGDRAYLKKLVLRLEACCDQLAERDPSERIKCLKPLVQNIKIKLDPSTQLRAGGTGRASEK